MRILLASRFLASTDIDHLLGRSDFPINTDSNRYLEYATPRYNLSRLPHERLLALEFGRFATFPPFQGDATSYPELMEGVPTLARTRFHVPESGPNSSPK